MFFRSLIYSVSFLWLVGCAPRTHDITHLRGEWILTESSIRNLPSTMPSKEARILIAEDSLFLTHQIPSDISCLKKASMTGAGKITLNSSKERPTLDFIFSKIDSQSCPTPYATQMYLSRSLFCLKSCDEIYYFIGDPDEGMRISFEKLVIESPGAK